MESWKQTIVTMSADGNDLLGWLWLWTETDIALD